MRHRVTTKGMQRAFSMLAAGLLLALGTASLSAHRTSTLQIDFDKCFAHPGDYPYLFTMAGTVSGDASGPFEARLLTRTVGIEPNWDYLEADYVVTGTLPFTARVGGRDNSKTKLAVLRGYVSVGPAWLVGARVCSVRKSVFANSTALSAKMAGFTSRSWRSAA